MKILKLAAENIKRLTVVEITPAGDLVEIAGKNGNGKTSVLDAIYWAMAGGGAIQAQPIRKGADSAHISLTLGNGEKVDFVVERSFTASGSYLSVKTPDGAKYPKPQQMLEDLLGALTFDPLDFMRSNPAKQFEILRGMLDLEVDLDALAKESDEIFKERTEKGRLLKTLNAAIDAAGDVQPTTPVDAAAIVDRIGKIDEHNAEVRQANAAIAAAKQKAADAAMRVKEAQRALEAALEAERAAKDQVEIMTAREVPALLEIGPLKQEIQLAEETNRRAERWKQLESRRAQAAEAKAGIDDLTALLDSLEKRRIAAISKAKMPIDGLSLGQGEVTFRGVPIAQASDAEQLKVSTAIAAALNPKLRVIRIRDGSLLDDDAMKWLAGFAQETDMQIWIERVGDGGPGAIVMEDGHVRGAVVEAAE